MIKDFTDSVMRHRPDPDILYGADTTILIKWAIMLFDGDGNTCEKSY